MIAIRKVGEMVVLDLEGLIFPEGLVERVETLLSVSCNKIAINLSTVNFAESNGLSALLAVNKLCVQKGGALILFGVQPYVKNLIEVTRLHQVLKISEDEAAALLSLTT